MNEGEYNFHPVRPSRQVFADWSEHYFNFLSLPKFEQPKGLSNHIKIKTNLLYVKFSNNEYHTQSDRENIPNYTGRILDEG
jgi:hypothetical protein